MCSIERVRRAGGGSVGLSVVTRMHALLRRGKGSVVNTFGRMFGSRQPTPIQVRYQGGEPVEFQQRPVRRGPRFLVTDVRERWIEESPWPFPSPMPVGGDQLRCWRVVAHSSAEPLAEPREFVLRMRAGPGVWDLTRVAE